LFSSHHFFKKWWLFVDFMRTDKHTLTYWQLSTQCANVW
jgi:hypothetical protein